MYITVLTIIVMKLLRPQNVRVSDNTLIENYNLIYRMYSNINRIRNVIWLSSFASECSTEPRPDIDAMLRECDLHD